MDHEFPIDWSQVKAGDTIYISREAFAAYCGDAEMICNDMSIWLDNDE